MIHDRETRDGTMLMVRDRVAYRYGTHTPSSSQSRVRYECVVVVYEAPLLTLKVLVHPKGLP